MEHVYVFVVSVTLTFVCAGIAKWKAKRAVRKGDFVYMVRPKKEGQ